MNRPARAPFVGAAILLVGTCSAQSFYVVDGLNRPGTNFLDLPAAEAAAQHGDTIQLRSDGGSYTAVATGKALTIVGSPGGIAYFSGAGPGFVITGIPAGREFVLRNVELYAAGSSTPRLVVQACLGRVHLQNVHVNDYTGAPALDVFACPAVTVRDSELYGFPGLAARNATIAVSGTRLYGRPAASTGAPAFPGARLQDTSAWLTNVQMVGGNAWGQQPPAAGLELVGASVSLTGTTTAARAQAGYLGSFAAPGLVAVVPAITGQNSLLRLDPGVVLGSTGGAPFVRGVTLTNATVAALSVGGDTTLHAAFDGGAGAAQVTVLGLPADPVQIPGVEGRLWVDTNLMLTLPGVLGGYSGFFEWQLPPGLTIAIQVVNLQAGVVELTTPAVVTSRR